MKYGWVLFALTIFAPWSFGEEKATTVEDALGPTIIDLITHAKQINIYHRDTRKFKEMGPDFYDRQLEKGPVLNGKELEALRTILLSTPEYDWVHRAECKINPDFVLHCSNGSAYVEVWVCMSCGLTNFSSKTHEGKWLSGTTLQSGTLHGKIAELMKAYYPGDPMLAKFVAKNKDKPTEKTAP
jgi:hypothetical protein